MSAYRWVQRFTRCSPMPPVRPARAGGGWYVDETYVKVIGV
jgi:hypothetical protein